MNLGAFMDPEYPIFSTTLCYLERDDAYLMLHRIKKQDDYNHDKWVGVGGKFERFESPEDCLVREVREERRRYPETGGTGRETDRRKDLTGSMSGSFPTQVKTSCGSQQCHGS